MSAQWSTDTWIEQLPTAKGSAMTYGQALYAGDTLTSQSGKYTLAYQPDGNLVLYGPGSSVVWASNTAGKPVGLCKLNDIGRVALFGPKKQQIWAQPAGNVPYVNLSLVVQDDGNLVLYGDLGSAGPE